MLSAQDFKRSLPRNNDFHFNCISFDKPELYLLNPKDEVWNFNFLSSYFCIKESFQPAKTGKYFHQFPKAELVINSINNEEEYYMVKNASIFLLGKVLEVPFLKTGKMTIHYQDGKKIYRSDILADRAKTNDYTIVSKFKFSDLINPPSLLNKETDSIKFEIKIHENAINAIEGTLIYNASSRYAQKQEFTIDASIRIKTKNKNKQNWVDETNIKLDQFPKKLIDIFEQPDKRALFVSNEYKREALSYEIKNGQVVNIRFQDDEITPASLNIAANESSVLMVPNPNFGETTLYLVNHPFDTYTFDVTNLVGKKVHSKKLTKEMGKEIELDLSFLRKGTYIYSIINSKGEKITTKRLVITSI